ncbi:SDR family oxidoreductase [Actinoplanes solisilvae]|uniref:SDR family oxidoreductase n=1 Tax=Actinoplanes solisilvae TaxID=2486853 RepID=UPI000FD8EF22|nr:SDR family NAD(P)-dependent oxidoreductase [Actinoplanes solisilvae]
MAGAVVIGAGPGIGRSVGLRFAREGLPVALVARDGAKAQAVADEVTAGGGSALGLAADSSDDPALRAALDTAARRFGPADVLVYNAAVIRADRVGELSVREHQRAWAVNVVGAITAAAHALPGMAARGHGTFIVTGGLPEPLPASVSLSLGKAGVRALTFLLDEQYGPSGVRITTVTVAGAVVPGTATDPDRIAEQYWLLHDQPPPRWKPEVLFPRDGLDKIVM